VPCLSIFANICQFVMIEILNHTYPISFPQNLESKSLSSKSKYVAYPCWFPSSCGKLKAMYMETWSQSLVADSNISYAFKNIKHGNSRILKWRYGTIYVNMIITTFGRYHNHQSLNKYAGKSGIHPVLRKKMESKQLQLVHNWTCWLALIYTHLSC